MKRVFEIGERLGLALTIVLWMAWVTGGAAGAWHSGKLLAPHGLAIAVVLLIAVITGIGGLIGYWVVKDLVDFWHLGYRVKAGAGRRVHFVEPSVSYHRVQEERCWAVPCVIWEAIDMARFTSKLDNVRVAAPCPADWDSMYGSERVRFCGQCRLNVYNLSEMSTADAERLIGQTEGRLCIRYYQRRDGSIITTNCPVGLRALRRRLSRVATAVASSILSFFAGIGIYQITAPRYSTGAMVMGDMSRPVPPSPGRIVVSPPPNENEILGQLIRIDRPKPTQQKLRELRPHR